jgi:diguanylate cyclase (GGDEF)-like protein/PAS domain S-box-containing protein
MPIFSRIRCLIHPGELTRVNKSLRESEEKYRELFDNATDFLYSMDASGIFTSVNKSLMNRLGYTSEEIIGAHISLILSPENLAIAQQMTAKKLAGETTSTQYELEISAKNGDLIPVELSSRLIYKDGKPVGVQGTGRDITERVRAEQEQRLAAMVFQSSNEAMMITDADNRIITVNASFTRMTGYAPDEIIGKDPKVLSSGRQNKDFYEQMWHTLSTTGQWQGELWNKRKDGEIFAEWLSVNTIYNARGWVHRRVALFSDITQKKESDEQIWKHANFDSLTQLPNRRLFRDRLEQEIKKSHRVGLPIALMFIDLDHFKEVNDTYGHDHGDILLAECAQRIVDCVREADTVARMGGDEFTVILTEIGEKDSIKRIAQDIIDKLAAPFHLPGGKANISASIGITLYPQDATDINELLKKADHAMYAAKRLGRNQFACFHAHSTPIPHAEFQELPASS